MFALAGGYATRTRTMDSGYRVVPIDVATEPSWVCNRSQMEQLMTALPAYPASLSGRAAASKLSASIQPMFRTRFVERRRSANHPFATFERTSEFDPLQTLAR